MTEKEVIGKYQIVSELGRGGMGIVYKAWEESLKRFVAIKMLSDRPSDDPAVASRFLREAQSVADLNHPNIIQVFAVDKHEGRPYFVMEYVEGDALTELIKAPEPIQTKQAVRLLSEIAAGLGAAHEKGVIHRDIKPDNIMLTKHGGVKVVDFGIAQVEDQNTKLTATGMAVGTPNYVCPEVCLGKEVDNRSDLFSLGIVFYEMLTGDAPFKADSPFGMMTNVVNKEAPNVTTVNPEVDHKLGLILNHLLKKDPEERYQKCSELLTDLKRYRRGKALTYAGAQDGQATTITSTVADASRPKSTKGSKAAWVMLLLAAVIAGAAGTNWYLENRSEDSSPLAESATNTTELSDTAATTPVAESTLPAEYDDSVADQTTEEPESDSPVDADPEQTLVAVSESASDTQNAITETPVEQDVALSVSQPPSDSAEGTAEPELAVAQTIEAPAPQIPDDEPAADTTLESTSTSTAAATVDQPSAVATPPSYLVHVIGDSTVARAVESVLKDALYAADLNVMNERVLSGYSAGMSLAALSSVARNSGVDTIVFAEVIQTGSRTLEYYGNSDRQSLADLKVEAISVRQGMNYGAPLQANLEYVALNAAQQARAAATPIARQLVQRLQQ